MSASLIYSKFRGTLIGVLCGDAFGAPYENRSDNKIDARALLEEINRQRHYDNSSILRFTDDTSMTKSTCRSLIENNGFNAKHMAKSYAEDYFRDPNRGYGAAVRTVFKQLADTRYSNPFGPASRQFNGRGSFGNGAAMRVSGLALFSFAKNLDASRTIDLVEDCSKITHSNAYAILGAIMLASAIRFVIPLEQDTFDESAFLTFLIDRMERLERPYVNKLYVNKLIHIRDLLQDLSIRGTDRTQSQIVSSLGNYVAAIDSVPLAIYSFLRGVSKFTDSLQIDNEFIRTLHWAISCGGDTDTIASMACGLLGAYIGIEKISEDLYKKCEAWEEMFELADNLAKLTGT